MWKPYSRSNSRSDSRKWLDAKISAQILGAFFFQNWGGSRAPEERNRRNRKPEPLELSHAAQRLKRLSRSPSGIENFKRDWKFQASHTPNLYFLSGGWECWRSRLKISSEICENVWPLHRHLGPPSGPEETPWCRGAKIAARQFLSLNCLAVTLTVGVILKEEKMPSLVGERHVWRHFRRQFGRG